MDLGLRGKVAAVAAASSGLGRASALALATEGARVAICGRDSDRLEEASRDIAAAAHAAGMGAPHVASVAVDLSTAAGPSRFIDVVEQTYGRVDILVVNNGGPPPGTPTGVSEDEWQSGVAQTFLSSVRLANRVVPGMRARGWGRIIFVTSVGVKQPIDNLAISTALRSGVVGYAKALADELGPEGITVNSVAPGSTATPRLQQLVAHRAQREGRSVADIESDLAKQIPLRRIGRPEEFGATVAFLASERASFVTGVVLPVDGGQCRSIT